MNSKLVRQGVRAAFDQEGSIYLMQALPALAVHSGLYDDDRDNSVACLHFVFTEEIVGLYDHIPMQIYFLDKHMSPTQSPLDIGLSIVSTEIGEWCKRLVKGEPDAFARLDVTPIWESLDLAPFLQAATGVLSGNMISKLLQPPECTVSLKYYYKLLQARMLIQEGKIYTDLRYMHNEYKDISDDSLDVLVDNWNAGADELQEQLGLYQFRKIESELSELHTLLTIEYIQAVQDNELPIPPDPTPESIQRLNSELLELRRNFI
jgi:hypothetical protein